ncbi:GNAT family N-acetyltransferase [Halobacteriales archaeon QH_6_68_27]|nr:MAG: GNAT family N-acetyltransferase [Halobacteriales archaeon QH_6_68_27]
MRFELVGWPADGPKLALDYRAFSYAGKFVMSNTGKAVALAGANEGSPAGADAAGATGGDASERPPPATDIDGVVDPDGRILGAVAFNADRTDPKTWWLRYITVRGDRRGEGGGPREALYRAGFAYTGEETGIAELVLACPPPDRSRATYQAGLDVFRARGPDADERSFLDRKAGENPPDALDPPE